MAYYIFILLLVQCGLVIPKSIPEVSPQRQNQSSPIPLSEFVNQPRNYFLPQHMATMFIVASCGDRLYDLSVAMSPECSRTIRATGIMWQNLALGNQVDEITTVAIANVIDQMANTSLQEHPLEEICKKLDKLYGENATLNTEFEKAKKMASEEKAVDRPAYSRTLLTSEDSMSEAVVDWLDKPTFAKAIVHLSLRTEMSSTAAGNPTRAGLFLRSCVEVAKKAEFADSMQNLYEKAVDDAIASTNGRLSETVRQDRHWLDSKPVKTFYKYVAENAALKKEIQSVAAIIGKDATTDDLDFSKI